MFLEVVLSFSSMVFRCGEGCVLEACSISSSSTTSSSSRRSSSRPSSCNRFVLNRIQKDPEGTSSLGAASFRSMVFRCGEGYAVEACSTSAAAAAGPAPKLTLFLPESRRDVKPRDNILYSHIYTHIYIYQYTYIYIHIYIYTYISTYKYIYIYNTNATLHYDIYLQYIYSTLHYIALHTYIPAKIHQIPKTEIMVLYCGGFLWFDSLRRPESAKHRRIFVPIWFDSLPLLPGSAAGAAALK